MYFNGKNRQIDDFFHVYLNFYQVVVKQRLFIYNFTWLKIILNKEYRYRYM
jgi:hypothetical protein